MTNDEHERIRKIVEQGGLLDPSDGRALLSALRAHRDGCKLINEKLDALCAPPCDGRILERIDALGAELSKLRASEEKAIEERDVSESELFQKRRSKAWS